MFKNDNFHCIQSVVKISSKWRYFRFRVVFIVWLFLVSANILLNRPAFQSADYTTDVYASKAVDGIYSTETITDCTHTQNKWQAWWAVDMGQEYIIASVTVTNKNTYGKLSSITTVMSHDRHGVSSHRQLHALFNSLSG